MVETQEERTELDGEEVNTRVVQVTVPTVRSDYLKRSRFVDTANEDVMHCFFTQRVCRWRISLFVWLLHALVHNARLIMMAKNEEHITKEDFLVDLANELSPPIPDDNHVLEKNEVMRRCKICADDHKNSKATWMCKGCGVHMHKKCFKTQHAMFVANVYSGKQKIINRKKRKFNDD